ncbi:MAG: hypothetical protein K2G93_02130 [Rikenella sp.]|nr:hypothetical protein [Rikenella sp.]
MEQKKSNIYVNSQWFPARQNEYVCWLDIMGIATILVNSIDQAANFILKFQSQVERVRKQISLDAVRVYPTMDGVYITAEDQTQLRAILKPIYSGLCKEFVNEPDVLHQSIVRGAIAFGPVIHGEDIDDTACPALSQETKQKILLGMPVSHAYMSERLAPPFGIYIHESARAFGPIVDGQMVVLSGPYYYWYGAQDVQVLRVKLDQYFEYYFLHPHYPQIDATKIKQYQLLISEYFTPKEKGAVRNVETK